MMIQDLIQNRNLSKYRLSKNSGIPYTTLTDICSGKAQLEKCSAETVYKLSKELGVSMEELLTPCFEKRCSFELFKSNVCHRLKALGDVEFIIEALEQDDIRRYYEKHWYPESFYLLAMVDYLCRINEIPLCAEYADLRLGKLSEPLYPAGVLAVDILRVDSHAKEAAFHHAIPEFLRFNIIENEVRNVV